jgi:hypothetical protein
VDDSTMLNSALIHMHKNDLDPSNFKHFHEGIHQAHKKYDSYTTKNELADRAAKDFVHVHHLDKILGEAPKAPRDFHVYTGVGNEFHVNKLRQAGHDQVHLPAYTSTSIDPDVAHGFAKGGIDLGPTTPKPHAEVIRIKIPKDSQHGIYLGSASTMEDEKEFILKRGTTIRFVGEPRRVKTALWGGTEQHTIVHNAEVVHSPEYKPPPGPAKPDFSLPPPVALKPKSLKSFKLPPPNLDLHGEPELNPEYVAKQKAKQKAKLKNFVDLVKPELEKKYPVAPTQIFFPNKK